MDSQSLQKTSILFLFLDLLRIYDVLKTKSKLRVLRFEDLGVLVSDSSGTPFWVTKHDGTHPAIYPNSAQSEAPGAKARPCQNMRAMDVLSFPAGKVWYVCQGNMCNRSGEAEELWRVPKSRGKIRGAQAWGTESQHRAHLKCCCAAPTRENCIAAEQSIWSLEIV